MATAPLMTNRGKLLMLKAFLQAYSTNFTTTFAIALLTGITPADHADVNTLADVTEHSTTSTGYSQFTMNRNNTDFPTETEDDTSDYGEITFKNVSWTASTAGIASATHVALITTGEAGTAKQVIAIWSLGGAQAVSNTQTLTIQGLKIRIT